MEGKGMSCKGFFECLLKLLNFLITLAGLSMLGYGIYLLVEHKRSAGVPDGNAEFGHPLLVAVPAVRFIYALIGVGVILLVISCLG